MTCCICHAHYRMAPFQSVVLMIVAAAAILFLYMPPTTSAERYPPPPPPRSPFTMPVPTSHNQNLEDIPFFEDEALSFLTNQESHSSRTTSPSKQPQRPITKPRTTMDRILNKNHRREEEEEDEDDDAFHSVFVDKNGNEYEPYSLAWRYLGVYMDCDVDEMGVGNYYYSSQKSGGSSNTGYIYDDEDYGQWDDDDVDIDEINSWYRRLLRQSPTKPQQPQSQAQSRNRQRELSGSADDGNDCSRKVLWAAYHDPRYSGGSIGEYQYYNFTSGDYTKDFCQTRRCVRMDCHEPNTHFKLVGVYKESDGLVDWAEQLFKHQGYCLWSDDDYETMQNRREYWPYYCRKLYYSGEDGSTLYMDVRPQSEGNIDVGIYLDEQCVTPSSYTFSDYIMMYYSYYGYYDTGQQIAATWENAIELWNEYMAPFKVCQPCRAYDLDTYLYRSDDDQSGSRSNSQDNRFLDENDGEGEEEQWGFNCYDDAGYTNCNQVGSRRYTSCTTGFS